MSFTPGPWEANGNGVHKRVSSHYAGCVATTHNNENRKDDARLIAAAPEMLKFINLCEQETACFKTDSLSHLQFVTETLNAMAQELIRKIEG